MNVCLVKNSIKQILYHNQLLINILQQHQFLEQIELLININYLEELSNINFKTVSTHSSESFRLSTS